MSVMPPEAPVKRETGVRKYLRRTLAQRVRQNLATRGIGALGEGVFLEKNVQLLRHPEGIELGAQVIVKEGARICPTNPNAAITIGDWTTIGYHTHLFATTRIEIGSNCLIAPFCYLVDSNHGIARDELIRDQPMSSLPIRIEDDVWLGANVTVLRGVHIGKGAVIGAGTVVDRDIPEYAIVKGNPAEVVDYRR